MARGSVRAGFVRRTDRSTEKAYAVRGLFAAFPLTRRNDWRWAPLVQRSVDGGPADRRSRAPLPRREGCRMTTTEAAPRTGTTATGEPAVQLRGLVKRYAGRSVVDGIDLDVAR